MKLAADQRLVSDRKLTRHDFEKLARQLATRPVRARKRGFIAARQAKRTERVDTHWNGKETTNAARPSDWIVTNLSPQQEPLRDRDGNLNTYVIAAQRFPELYEPTGTTTPLGATYRAKATVLMLGLRGGFDIVAPWSERQRAKHGYLILNGDEVYGNDGETFQATYEILPA